MVNFKDPTTASLISLVVSTVLFMIGFYLVQPEMVKSSNKTGDCKLSWKKLVAQSLTFSLVISTIVLMVLSNKRGVAQPTRPTETSQFNNDVYSLPYAT